MKNKPIAVLCSDIHLTLKPPIARAKEPNWLARQSDYLHQLAELGQRIHRVPIICAGDIFDKWNSPAELINFAIANLPFMYAIPGQHDLPYHSYDDRHRSAYNTLVEAGAIINLEPGEPLELKNKLVLHGFPWGHEITPVPNMPGPRIHLAVVHKYLWTGKCKYPNAPEDASLASARKDLVTYDAAVYGDNHKGFLSNDRWPAVLNCGTFMRRHSDEIEYRPRVGLLLSNGKIRIHYLDTSADVISSSHKELNDNTDLQTFVKKLESFKAKTLDYGEAVRRFLNDNKIDSAVRKEVMRCVQEKKIQTR